MQVIFVKIVIKNGLIIDGTASKPYKSDLLLERNRISKIGKIDFIEDARIIDAKGCAVCPGFIDTHSHSDLMILVNPYNEIKIRQGVTTELLGQDGVSMAPLPQNYISSWRRNIAGLNGSSDEIDWTYETTDNYLNIMEKQGVGLNQSYLVPHGNVRMEVLGLNNTEPTKEGIKSMQDVLRREMEAGAFGLSTGLIYIPCAYSKTKELIELCKVVAEYDGVFVIHQRSEADTIVDSMKEVIKIGMESGVKIHISHFKVCGKKNWKHIDTVLELLESAQEKGLTVSFDQYPYIAGSTMLGAILPPWVHDGGTDKLLERLENSNIRAKIIKDIEKGIPGWDNFIDFAGFDGIFITSVKSEKNKDLVGKSLKEISEIVGKDPYNAAFDLLYEEKNAVGMIDFYGKEKHVAKFMKRPEQNVCTDGLLAGKPHPRVYGSFPRVLGKYVREEKVLSLEEAIYKMSKKPAEVFGFEKRGVLKEGYYADVVVFNPEEVRDKSTFENPRQYPEGIEYVIINGHIVLEKGEYNKILAGKVLRKSF